MFVFLKEGFELLDPFCLRFVDRDMTNVGLVEFFSRETSL
jgi:hypothetical protein